MFCSVLSCSVLFCCRCLFKNDTSILATSPAVKPHPLDHSSTALAAAAAASIASSTDVFPQSAIDVSTHTYSVLFSKSATKSSETVRSNSSYNLLNISDVEPSNCVVDLLDVSVRLNRSNQADKSGDIDNDTDFSNNSNSIDKTPTTTTQSSDSKSVDPRPYRYHEAKGPVNLPHTSDSNPTLPADPTYIMTGGTGSLRFMAPEVAIDVPYNEKV